MEKEYRYTFRSRGFISVFSLFFVAIFSVASIISNSLVFQMIGVVLLFLLIRGLFSLVKKDEWKIKITDENIEWDYARWPKSKGIFKIKEIKKIVVDDCAGKLRITQKDDREYKLRIVAPAGDIYEFFKDNFQNLELQFIEGT